MADAFTVCDQHFCSAMTSTYPNRSYLWTGTIREEQNSESKAHIRNTDSQFGASKWKTFPERLEEHGVSWKIYQNDVSCGGGFGQEERALLANQGCNTLEYFESFNVKFTPRYVEGLQKQVDTLPAVIQDLKTKAQDPSAVKAVVDKMAKSIEAKENVLSTAKTELETWSQVNYDKLSPKEKSLHQRAFTNNKQDADYHHIDAFNYLDGDVKRKVNLPKGDLLHQFRADINAGDLPTVSWLVSPAKFSDHPAYAWYGSWFISEIFNALTVNPEVWKKTIFILTYDENDGYFDHVPPFIAPNPKDPETGKVSDGIDTGVEYIRLEQELPESSPKDPARGGPIGLGNRVPMIIASPWSRGGQVCSQVFDHTSSIQFLEKFLSKKFNRDIKETNISAWRRTVCGDLTAAFNLYKGEKIPPMPFLKKDPFFETMHKALYKQLPNGFKQLSKEDIEQLNRNPSSSPFMPQQEPGIRPSCALPYQLYAEGALSKDKKRFAIKMEAGNKIFGKLSAGSPFNVYAPGKYRSSDVHFRSYAVAAGDSLMDSWPLDAFENELYHLRAYGPNGFLREYKGNAADPHIEPVFEYELNAAKKKSLTGNVILKVINLDTDHKYEIEIKDHAYQKKIITKTLGQAGSQHQLIITINLGNSYGWYDFSIRVAGFNHFERRYAGRVETGKMSYSDPAMGNVPIS